MHNVSRPLRITVAAAAALAVAAVAAAGSALPASARELAPAARAVNAAEWWLPALDAPAAWRAAPGEGRGVTVAVLSTGVDGSHPDLTGTVTTGPDFAKTGRGPGQAYWADEGTAVASLIAGHGHGAGGAEGITGIAPGARILSVQVTLEYDDPLDSDAAMTGRLPAAIAEGIRYAVDHGASVISLPLDPGTMSAAGNGNPAADGSPAERAAVAYAIAHDVLLVAPAGDNGGGGNAVNYPAAYPGVIAVGATARDGELAPFTNTGAYVALTAPGASGPAVAPDAATAGPLGRPHRGRARRRVPDPGLHRHVRRAHRRRRRAHPRPLPVAHGRRGHRGDRGRRDRARGRRDQFRHDEYRRDGGLGPRRAERREGARPGRRHRRRSSPAGAASSSRDSPRRRRRRSAPPLRPAPRPPNRAIPAVRPARSSSTC